MYLFSLSRATSSNKTLSDADNKGLRAPQTDPKQECDSDEKAKACNRRETEECRVIS